MAASTAAASAAAAERARQLMEEEELLTPYTSDDLKEDWEFKIVRSNFSSFGKPENLRKLIEEEARAGWVMVEKFDDTRVRFKRSPSARSRDSLLPPGVDPYRTTVGISQEKIALWGILGTIFIIALVIGVIVIITAVAG
jgi:hypothetical protein